LVLKIFDEKGNKKQQGRTLWTDFTFSKMDRTKSSKCLDWLIAPRRPQSYLKYKHKNHS
jgi:hypothetical protein